MSKNLIMPIFILLIVNCTFAQNIDFAINLGYDGLVHTNNSSVIDKAGNIFVAGGTRNGLKVTSDAFQATYNGDSGGLAGGDIYLMKLTPEGEVIYSTYIGGSQDEYYCNQITMDEFGNVFVGFTTDSQDLPVTENAYQKNNEGDNEHYIIKFSNDCKYLASTYLGGSQSDHWTKLGINDNILYLVGCTKSEDFPTTLSVIQEQYNVWGGTEEDKRWMEKDITITALSLDLEDVLCSTYLGGKDYESASSFTFDKKGRILLSGSTKSDNYPTSDICYDDSYASDYDAFVTVISPDLSEIIYSTFLGSDKADKFNSIVSIDHNNVLLVGDTQSMDFPVTSNALKQNINGVQDAVIVKLDINSNELVYSSYLGGTGGDSIKDVEITDKGKCLIVALTASSDFPTTDNALYPTPIGAADLAIIQLDESLQKVEYSSFLGGTQSEYMIKTSNNGDDNLYITLTSKSEDFPATIKYAEKDSTNLNILVKFDFEKKILDEE